MQATYVLLISIELRAEEDIFVSESEAVSPRIITRDEWGARSPQGPVDDLSIDPPPFVVIHHSAGIKCDTEIHCKKIVKNIQNFHMNERHWSDIGYNFLVGGDGAVYEGRGWGKRGAHTKPYNAESIGICVLGNYENDVPKEIVLNEVQSLIQYGVENKKILSDYMLIGHKQAAPTTCPGVNLFNLIKTWSHFDTNPTPKRGKRELQ